MKKLIGRMLLTIN